MNPALQIIQFLIAPVVMISANGLICLAFYNRMGAVMGRTRAFHKERYDLAARLASLDTEEYREEAAHVRRRMRVLGQLCDRMVMRARLLRNSLWLLLTTILFMLGCSIDLGLLPYWPHIGWLAPLLFVAGVVAMAAGVGLAMLELGYSISALKFEGEMMSEFDEEVEHLPHAERLEGMESSSGGGSGV